MVIFNYTALKAGKDFVVGKIEANSVKEARESLRKLDLIPTKLEEQVITVKKNIFNLNTEKKIRLGRIGLRDKIDFTNTLYVLSKTGVSIVEALLFIEVNSNSKKVQRLSSELKRLVLAGSSLSEAVLKFPQTFDKIYTGLIKAGEESGELDSTLGRMVALLDKQDRLKSKVISTMMYPVFVILLAMVVTTVMLTFVFPAFKDMYDQMDAELPLITTVLMNIGVFLKTYWIIIPIIFIGTFGSLYTILKWPTTKRILDKMSLRIPVFRTFIRYSALSNFIAVLKVAFDAGVPIVDGLMLANATVNNIILKDSLRESTTKIQHGQSLSLALKSSDAIPGIIMCMISTGEHAGQLGDMLGDASEYIDTQLERVIDLLNRIFEPILLLIIGGLVLVLALALYLPLFQSYSNMI